MSGQSDEAYTAMVVKVATRAAVALVLVFAAVASCTYGVERQEGLTERACVAKGLDERCDKPR